ncbi:MAG TPA: hypothetical protein EYO58_03740 [Flavobacteriales bacterium]|nr:hypothetical protein [Flavobacteriales bacterium]
MFIILLVLDNLLVVDLMLLVVLVVLLTLGLAGGLVVWRPILVSPGVPVSTVRPGHVSVDVEIDSYRCLSDCLFPR